MTKYYLKLNFKDAGLFKNTRKTKDKRIDSVLNEKFDRHIEDNFKEPICLNHVYNMLHVLFGQRPVSTNNTCLYSRIEYLVDKAKDSFIKIESVKTNKDEYISENIQTKKSVYDSYPQMTQMSFHRASKYLGEELYLLFKDTIKKVLKIDIDNTELTYIEVRDEIQKNLDNPHIKSMMEVFKDNKKTGFKRELETSNSVSIDSHNNTRLLNLNGFDTYSKLSGSILVPISDEDRDKLKESPCNATILDGGAVYIEKLINPILLDTYEYRKVSEISNEKIVKA